MKSIELCVLGGLVLTLAACGEGGGSGGTLEGTYYPQHAPGAPRYELALTDSRWEFSADGTVTTIKDAAGAREWTYEVSGKDVRLTAAGTNNYGARRTFTMDGNGCLWSGKGRPDFDTLFCP